MVLPLSPREQDPLRALGLPHSYERVGPDELHVPSKSKLDGGSPCSHFEKPPALQVSPHTSAPILRPEAIDSWNEQLNSHMRKSQVGIEHLGIFTNLGEAG